MLNGATRHSTLNIQHSTLRKLFIALTYLATVALPATLAAIALFGCCALPFHRYIHKVLPLCTGILKTTPKEPTAPPPARPRVAPPVVEHADAAVAPDANAHARHRPCALRTERSAMSHGALRCDDDIGLNLLHATFLI